MLDVPYPLQIFEWILLGIWVIFWSYWLITAWLNRSPVKRRQSSMLPTLPIIAVVIWILVTGIYPDLVYQQIFPDGIVASIAGTIITILGLGFAIWARLHLGTNWSGLPIIRVDHKLIRTGPYTIVRNPIYTGILIAFVGTAIVIGKFWAIIAILIVFVAFFMKIRIEEKFLLEEFGEDYLKYKKEVKSLIPFII